MRNKETNKIETEETDMIHRAYAVYFSPAGSMSLGFCLKRELFGSAGDLH